MNGIYVHIPFCNSICSYCDFPKQIAKEETKELYLKHLISEIQSFKDLEWIEKTQSIYIGGGTPNSLSIMQLEQLFLALEPYLKHAKENTIEINPELLTEEQIALFLKYNIHRISIGVQTFKTNLIETICRKHTKALVVQCVKKLKKAGISNINIDMLYGLPKQTMKDLKYDVKQFLKLKVPHISYYSLILEEKTILSYQMKHAQINLPDDDLVVDMADYLTQKLKKRQFIHYEISNYAKKGYESIHNLGYWNCEEYIGFGAGACGYYRDIRYQNPASLKQYYKGIQEKNMITKEEAKKEFMMLGLRKLEGVSILEYYKKFQSYPNDDFDIVSLLEKDLIEEKNNFIRIKENRIWLGNLVFEAFVGGE